MARLASVMWMGAVLTVAACGAKAPADTASANTAPTADADPVTPAMAGEPAAAASLPTLFAVTVADDRFSTFASLAKLAGLEPTLQQMGGAGLTVFVPTNDAFAGLPPGALALLRQPENRTALTEMLRFHMVTGRWERARLGAGSVTLPTLAGHALLVETAGPVLSVSDSIIIAADVQAANGVVHAIDAVLLPPPSRP